MRPLPGPSSTRAALVFLVSLVPLAPAAAQSPARVAAQLPARVAVTPCQAADTLFHTSNDDVKGIVHVYRKHGWDSTSVFTDPRGQGATFHVTLHVRNGGQHADSIPWSQMTLFLRGAKGADSLTEGAMPTVTPTVNDTTQLDLAPAQVGASRGGTDVIPVSAYVSSINLLAIARARSVALTIGPNVVVLTPDDRRNLRALYHVALCGELPTP